MGNFRIIESDRAIKEQIEEIKNPEWVKKIEGLREVEKNEG